MSRPKIACVDLFCGIGGLTHGLVRGGIRVAAGIDLDANCRFPYESNNRAKFIEADVRKLSGAELQVFWSGEKYSLLAGCAPCQTFSTYSRKVRKLRRDTRWELVDEFARLTKEARPDFVTMENVPQLADHEVFQRFLAALSDYRVWHRVVECSEYGVPQTRKRLVLLASRLGEMKLAGKPRRTATVRETIGHLTPLAAGESDVDDPLHSACSLSEINLKRIRASKPGGTWRDWSPELLAECHRRRSGETYPSVYGRMEWDAPAPTITTQCFGYGNGRFGHPDQDRAITLREAALLQTFPASYRFLKTGDRFAFHILGRLIGNAVPVSLGELVAKSLIAHASHHQPR